MPRSRQWRLAAERARYEAERAERQYRAVEPENRLVARGLETEWEKRLRDLAAAEAELERRERQRPRTLSEEEKKKIFSLGSDLRKVWTAPTTTDRDRKELLRALLEEVIVRVDRAERRGHLTLRWQGGTLTECDLSLPRMKPHGLHTDEDTISLLRRLAVHYPDDVIAGILNRQGRKTATGSASRRIRLVACVAIATFRATNRRPNHPRESGADSQGSGDPGRLHFHRSSLVE